MNRTCRVLSLHQPWASLLVNGVKRIENRQWRTRYRGRVWVHATSKKPTPEDIQQLEELYELIFQMEGYEQIPLPEVYPTSALLGCVNVVDCVAAFDLEKWPTFPDQLKLELGDGYCFLCNDPLCLETPQNMRGYPGLWYLPQSMTDQLEAQLRTPVLGDKSIQWEMLHDHNILHQKHNT